MWVGGECFVLVRFDDIPIADDGYRWLSTVERHVKVFSGHVSCFLVSAVPLTVSRMLKYGNFALETRLSRPWCG